MRSIGNDIVDLKLAKTQSNWQRKGFLEKQFTKIEQEFILKSENPFCQVWLFWSMKEAAYKCYVQQYKKRFFAPKKFSCKTLSNSKGLVTVGNKMYYISYLITRHYVYSVAQNVLSSKMVSKLLIMGNVKFQSKIIKQNLLTYFSKGIELKKNEMGIPYLYQQEKKLPISISITHHGGYGAFAISY